MTGVKRKISEVEGVEGSEIPSVKDLASSDPRTRRDALSNILSHLEKRSQTSPLTTTQCQQLWRGFHVALYMHDSKNAISVQNLIITLAETFETMRSKDVSIEAQSGSTIDISNGNKARDKKPEAEEFNGFSDDESQDEATDSASSFDNAQGEHDNSWLSTYTAAFWSNIIREWATIDSHRMNKYLLLVRIVTRTLFKVCTDAAASTVLVAEGDELSEGNDEGKDGETPRKQTKPSKSSSTKSNSKSKSRSTTKPSKDQSPDTRPTRSTTTTTNLKVLLNSQSSLLTTNPLSPRDTKIPNGLKIHMLDIYTDELEKALTSTKTTIETQRQQQQQKEENNSQINDRFQLVISQLRKPIERIAKEGIDKNIRVKAKDVLGEMEDIEL